MKKKPSANPAAFMGAVTAEATHELNNILSVISESAGLIQDICAFSKEGPLQKSDTVLRCLGTIDSQIKKGTRLLKSLNHLAHCPDYERLAVKLPGALEKITRLCSRAAVRQNVRLLVAEPATLPVLNTDPLLFQMAIYAAIQFCLDLMTLPGELQLGCTQVDETVTIHLAPRYDDAEQHVDFDSESGSQTRSDLTSLVTALNGGIRLDPATREIRLSLNPLAALTTTP